MFDKKIKFQEYLNHYLSCDQKWVECPWNCGKNSILSKKVKTIKNIVRIDFKNVKNVILTFQ
jgi:hypothetical protein